MNFLFKFFEWLFSEEPIEELEVTKEVPNKKANPIEDLD